MRWGSTGATSRTWSVGRKTFSFRRLRSWPKPSESRFQKSSGDFDRRETDSNGPKPSDQITGIFTKSAAEGAVEQHREEVLGLAQRLALHRTQALHSLNQCRE